MPPRFIDPSEYKSMWLFTMFDLPVNDRKGGRHYYCFRNLLLDSREFIARQRASLVARSRGTNSFRCLIILKLSGQIPEACRRVP